MAICSIEGCDGVVRTRGWCNAHYMRWWHAGTTDGPPVKRRPKGRTCTVEGCGRKHRGNGFCDGHLRRFLKYGDAGPAEFEPRNPGAVCKIDGCGSPAQGRGWCNSHYLRWRETGSPITPLPEHGSRWVGDAASYNAVHLRLKATRGKASAHPCASCGDPAQEWAFDHSDPSPLGGPIRPYSTDLSRYIPLCRNCHRRMDAERTSTKACSVLGCPRPHKARGLCKFHYDKVRLGK